MKKLLISVAILSLAAGPMAWAQEHHEGGDHGGGHPGGSGHGGGDHPPGGHPDGAPPAPAPGGGHPNPPPAPTVRAQQGGFSGGRGGARPDDRGGGQGGYRGGPNLPADQGGYRDGSNIPGGQDRYRRDNEQRGVVGDRARPGSAGGDYDRGGYGRGGDVDRHGAAPGFRGGPGFAARPGGRFAFVGSRGGGAGFHGEGRFNYGGRSFDRFHARPFYYPSGWGYRRWGVGGYLPALFLTSSYFLDDFGAYDLGPPPPDCRWVRYGPDALAVNVYTGEVVDVAYGVFWW